MKLKLEKYTYTQLAPFWHTSPSVAGYSHVSTAQSPASGPSVECEYRASLHTQCGFPSLRISQWPRPLQSTFSSWQSDTGIMNI